MKEKLRPSKQLASYTTFKVGGEAKELRSFASKEELQEITLTYEHFAHTPYVVLGGGSNMLVADTGFPGVALKNVITGIEVVREDEQSVVVRVGAGEVFDEVVVWSVKAGYWGLENLSHIPGSVGATPVQNVGAYGVEIESLIESVEVFDPSTSALRDFTKAECGFMYRHSFFKEVGGKGLIVTAVTYRLSKVPKPIVTYKDVQAVFANVTDITQQEIRDAVISIRSKKFPNWHEIGTAGSFFKNPIITTQQYQNLLTRYPELPGYVVDEATTKVSLGWILDKVCNLRGYREGAVGTYESQSLVIVNYGGATAAEIAAFAAKIESAVLETTGISIEWEVTKVGF